MATLNSFHFPSAPASVGAPFLYSGRRAPAATATLPARGPEGGTITDDGILLRRPFLDLDRSINPTGEPRRRPF